MFREFRSTFLYCYKDDKSQAIKTILGAVAVLFLLGFIIYHTATAIPQPGTVAQHQKLEVIR